MRSETYTSKRTNVITNTGECVLVSTVFNGDFYETMVFKMNAWTNKVDDYDELETDVYDYPDVADVGHEQMVDKWMKEEKRLKDLRH